MVARRECQGRKASGMPCGAPPQHESVFCWVHDPAQAAAAAEARRLGGLRRRRELAVAGAYDFAGLGSIPDLRRLVLVAVLDILSLENSIARARTLGYLVQVAAKLLETGELEERLKALEGAVLGRERGGVPSPFEAAEGLDPFPQEQAEHGR